MSETPFARTGYARKLFESQIPELLRLLREIADCLKTIAEGTKKPS